MTKHFRYKEICIIKMHIPRTAGTTLERVLLPKYNKSQIYKVDGENVEKSIQVLINNELIYQNSLRLVTGHMDFGLHNDLTHLSKYITMVRNPIQRIISHYYYALNNNHHYLHAKIINKKMNLIDYVKSGISKEMDNGQTRAISGMNEIPFGECKKDMLDIAISNIEKHFILVGLTEKFDETLILLADILGYSSYMYYAKAKIGKYNQKRSDKDIEANDVIARYNALDIDLYKYVEESFNNIIEKNHDQFLERLRSFKARNKILGNIFEKKNKLFKKLFS